MRIIDVPRSGSNRIDVDLEHDDEVIDPRHYGGDEEGDFRFSVKGRTLTITRTDADDEDAGWPRPIRLRAYRRSTEIIPDFTSTVYTYHGLRRECVPKDVTKVIFAPSVTTIQHFAFNGCDSLVRITIPDHVTRIEGFAFFGCDSLKSIRLSVNLVHIGDAAFRYCSSLEGVFLPPTVTDIGNGAFKNCISLRFMYVPESIDHIGEGVFIGCNRLSTTVSNNLSKLCYSSSINPQMINECIQEHGIELTTQVDDQQMTALHILCANPFVTADCIRAYLQLAPEAANQEDSDGMTPFQYLCKSDVKVIEDRSFSSLMIWWYHCMPPQETETGKKRKRE